MCQYCQGEGCGCGKTADYPEPCQSEIVGTKACSICKCESMPWWSDLKLPGSRAIADMMWDLESDEKFFPAGKMKILKMAPDSDAELVSSLPERMYNSTGDVVGAMIDRLPPIEWDKQLTEILWKYPADALAPGQQLVVGKDQVIMMVSKSGKPCDEFPEGRHVVSQSNCPLLAQESRKVLPGYNYSILNGSPLFFSTIFEFEMDLTTFGQTRAMRRATAKGTARVKVISPKKFVQQFGSERIFTSQQALAAVTKFCGNALKDEMNRHELQELSRNSSLLEVPLKQALDSVGLYPVRISFSYIGELGPGMFMASSGQAGNPQSAEQMRQMTDSMRAAQLSKLQEIQQLMRQRGQPPQNTASSQALTPPTLSCPNCNTLNPQGSKFCNNCGNPIPAAKKTCPSCGKLLDSSVKFCGNCGTRV